MNNNVSIGIARLPPYLRGCQKDVVSFSTEEPPDFTGYKIYMTLPNTSKEAPNVLHASQLTVERQLTKETFSVETLEPETNRFKKIWHKKKIVVLAQEKNKYIFRGNLALTFYKKGELEEFWLHAETNHQLKSKYSTNVEYKLDGVPIQDIASKNLAIKCYAECDPLHLSMQKARGFMKDYCACVQAFGLENLPSMPKSWVFTKLKIDSQLDYKFKRE